MFRSVNRWLRSYDRWFLSKSEATFLWIVFLTMARQENVGGNFSLFRHVAPLPVFRRYNRHRDLKEFSAVCETVNVHK